MKKPALFAIVLAVAACGSHQADDAAKSDSPESDRPEAGNPANGTPDMPAEVAAAQSALAKHYRTAGPYPSDCPASHIDGRWFLYCHPRGTKDFGGLFYLDQGVTYSANGPAMGAVKQGAPAMPSTSGVPFSPFTILKQLQT